MKISVLGLGWFGEPLGQALKQNGNEILGSTRSEEKKKSLEAEGFKVFTLSSPDLPHEELLTSDIIVLNIPPSRDQLLWFKAWPWKKNPWIIFISSTSVTSHPDSQNARELIQEEEWIRSQFDHWTILRFGGLLGRDRHPGKYLSGKKNLKDGHKSVRLLHLDFAIEFTMNIIQNKKINETLEVVNIEGISRKEFYTNYCLENHLPLPEFD